MSSTPPDSPEVEEGSPFGGVECEESSPEPAQQVYADGEPEEQNLFPFVNVNVELHEDPSASHENSEEVNNDESGAKIQSVGHLEVAPETVAGLSNVNTEENQTYENEALEDSGSVAPDSTGHDINEDSVASETFDSNLASDVYDSSYVVKSELVEPDYKHLQKSYLEDFIYSSTSSFDEGSNSNFDDSREEPRGTPLSRFPKIVKALEASGYETLQALFQLLYQRSAWDTEQMLTHGILEFSGFTFNQNSEDYFNREMMLRTQPDEMLLKIASILGLDHVPRLLADGGSGKIDLISAIMSFLSKPSKKTRLLKPVVKVESTPAVSPKKPMAKCGCRSRCIQRFTRAEKTRLLEYLEELKEKNLFDNYILHLMACKKIIRDVESFESSHKKLKEVYYNYKCKVGKKEISVCKGAFCILHGIKMAKINHLQPILKSGNAPNIDVNDFPPIFPGQNDVAVAESEKEKDESSPKRIQQRPGPLSTKKVWVSSEEQIRRMEEELKGNIDLSCAASPKVILEKIDIEFLQKNTINLAENNRNAKLTESKSVAQEQNETKTVLKSNEGQDKSSKEKKKLKDFPLVVKSIEEAAEELLIDVHFLLFLTSADVDKVKSNILDFSGFSFVKESEEFDERNEFLRRMSFKIISDVARSFSVEVFNSKEETIKNLMKFLSNPDESYLRTTVSMPLSLSDVELDDFGDLSDSDESITCEVVEKKVECIILLSSGEDSDGEGKSKKPKTPKKASLSIPAQPASVPTLASAQPAPTSTPAAPCNSSSGKRRLRDFETICKIVNTHPHEYLVDIFELLYLKKHEPTTLRDDILDFSGFTFEMKSPEYIKRKQLLDRMLYNSVRRIYNTLIHNTTEVKVFSKPTMITEIFQFLFHLPDHDTSVRPSSGAKPVARPTGSPMIKNAAAVASSAAAGINIPSQTGKLSDLKRVFQRVACFPCEYLIDVHKLLFMIDCDPKVIRQNIFAFKGFDFDVDSQEFQQRKMYLEYLTFHSLRKISSVLTTRSVDLRNSTKHELATHLTQVLAEYTKMKVEEDLLPPGAAKVANMTGTPAVSSTTTPVENIVVTPIIDPSITNSSSFAESPQSSTTSTPLIISTSSAPLAISIVDARSVSSVTTTPVSTPKRKRKATPSKQTNQKVAAAQDPQSQFADVNLPEVEQYRKIYGQIYQPTATPITGVVPVVQGVQLPNSITGVQHTISPKIVTQVPSKQAEIIVPGECIVDDNEEVPEKRKKNNEKTKKEIKGSQEKSAAFHHKIKDVPNANDDEDCDKPLSSLVGHPIDSVLKKHIVDTVEKSDLETITINGVIQKIFNMYPKFDLSYRKEFIKSTLRSILYRLGEEKNSTNDEKRDTNSPDCSVTTTDNSESVSEAPMECS